VKKTSRRAEKIKRILFLKLCETLYAKIIPETKEMIKLPKYSSPKITGAPNMLIKTIGIKNTDLISVFLGNAANNTPIIP